jgi:hypothetical protein
MADERPQPVEAGDEHNLPAESRTPVRNTPRRHLTVVTQ